MPDEEKREIPRMDEEEIIEAARRLVARRIVTATSVPPHMIASVFMPIALGGLVGIDLDDVGDVIGDLDKAGPRTVNGYPIFFSCQVVHRDDWAVIVEKAQAAQAALDGALKGPPA